MKRYLFEKKSITKTIIIVIAVVSSMSILVTSMIVQELVEKHDDELIRVISSDVHEDIRRELLKHVMIAQTMANDVFLHDNLKTEHLRSEAEETKILRKYLTNMKRRLGCNSGFLVSEYSKNYWQPSGLVKRIDIVNDPHDSWYSDVLKRDVDYLLHVDSDEANDMQLAVFVNTPIRDVEGEFLGVCGVNVKMATLQKLLENDEQKYKIKINLVDSAGVVQIDTDNTNIENVNMDEFLSYQKTEDFILKKMGKNYVITKYIPECDWYLIIQRKGEDMQNTFSNIVLYMFLVFSVALAILLVFLKVSLNKRQQEIEEMAKKHGIASHAGLYMSMHLIDLRNNMIQELCKDPKVDLFSITDGKDANKQLNKAIREMTDPGDLSAMLHFINFGDLSERMKNRHVIDQEFLTTQYGWCKAYFFDADRNEDGEIVQIVFAVELIDEKKQYENHLMYMSSIDAMTKLRNRGNGERTITELMADGKEGMLCLLDADKFKSINDNFGHDVGDKAIKAIASCIKDTFKDSDILLRLGGDEFAVYAVGVVDERTGQNVIDRFFSNIDKINIPEMGDNKLQVSLGATFFHSDEGLTFEELYKQADKAAYTSKKVQGNHATFYSQIIDNK
ncbi:MAG: sensor domain-containing diguanylate cyclase [Anaerovibrio sp.]|uniref:sensor domain-containing diguanylate cyclase n=1 Tax=Anaerovibrio sp. TaxID=1872532 RepID=UPI002600DD5A|nr:sensor domain-containing diguanylate cyclase [Anaerovibrio sp.]MCR5176064.1 sensor domain-containing diguanylate cyclase [Anaerovibrio sp.]